MKTVLILLALHLCAVNAQRPLETYNIDRSQISTSGVSSGGAMATQIHVAYSSLIMGAGILAGVPYYCAQGDPVLNSLPCSSRPSDIDVEELIAATDDYASAGDIDSTLNLVDSRVFVYAGTLDSVVHPGVALKVDEYYQHYNAAIKLVNDVVAEHTVPTIDYGNPCDEVGSPFIGKCNYDGAYETLDHMYPGLTRPDGAVPLLGDFYEFDQTEYFVDSPSMDDIGYVYVPSGCIDSTNVCRLHIAFHGCQQSISHVGDEFARSGGFSAVGELNNIIILYPQTATSLVNPLGCWDWWGYTNFLYATRRGDQPLVISQMIDRLSLGA